VGRSSLRRFFDALQGYLGSSYVNDFNRFGHTWQVNGVEKLRNRQVKNYLAVTMMSLGVPMIWMGDEVRSTQGGNNNAYCQDNEISWFDWTQVAQHADVHRFVSLLNERRLLRDAERLLGTARLRAAEAGWRRLAAVDRYVTRPAGRHRRLGDRTAGLGRLLSSRTPLGGCFVPVQQRRDAGNGQGRQLPSCRELEAELKRQHYYQRRNAATSRSHRKTRLQQLQIKNVLPKRLPC
jgi:hypothetical protein